MFGLNKLASNDHHRIAISLKRAATSNIKTLEDIRIHGRFEYETFLRRLEVSSEGFEIPFSNNMEEMLAEKGEIFEHWQYFINPYNFRGKWNLDTNKKIKIACFGDSFTFGDGLSEEDTHVHNLAIFFPEAELYNVGKGGASLERIARTFAAFTKFVDADIAVFTLPHVQREFFIDDKGITIDLIPHENHNHIKYMEFFLQLPETYQKIKLSLNVNYILDVANILGIKVLFTSWDVTTHNLLKICAPENTADKFFPNNLDNKQARDKMHPGKQSQLRHAKNIRKELYDRAWIQR